MVTGLKLKLRFCPPLLEIKDALLQKITKNLGSKCAIVMSVLDTVCSRGEQNQALEQLVEGQGPTNRASTNDYIPRNREYSGNFSVSTYPSFQRRNPKII